MTDKKVVEAEIISEPEGFSYKQKYSSYSKRAKKTSKFAWTVAVISLPLSLVPIIGFIFAIFAFLVCVFKKITPVLPFVSLIISGFITAFVLVISALINIVL